MNNLWNANNDSVSLVYNFWNWILPALHQASVSPQFRNAYNDSVCVTDDNILNLMPHVCFIKKIHNQFCSSSPFLSIVYMSSFLYCFFSFSFNCNFTSRFNFRNYKHHCYRSVQLLVSINIFFLYIKINDTYSRVTF